MPIAARNVESNSLYAVNTDASISERFCDSATFVLVADVFDVVEVVEVAVVEVEVVVTVLVAMVVVVFATGAVVVAATTGVGYELAYAPAAIVPLRECPS
jgi:hypothetical protein